MIFVDLETSGLNPKRHSILSIGAVDYDHPANYFYAECRIRRGAVATNEALQVNGFTREQIRDPRRRSPGRITMEFLVWAAAIDDRTLAGENVFGVDWQFLQDSAKRNDLPWIFGRRLVDLHGRSYSDHDAAGLPVPLRNNVSDLNLSATLKFAGLPSQPAIHNALEDARLEAEAYSRLTRGTPLLSDYSSYPIPTYLLDSKKVSWAGA